MKSRHMVWPFLAILLYFYLNLFADALIDDAFITLRYVKTLLLSGTWGFIPGHVANAVTSPLNIILLAFAGLFLGSTVNAVICMAVINLMFILVLLARISRHLFENEIFGYLAAGALIFNPLIISTLGLESMLFAGLYILAVYLYITGRWSWLAAALGLITITRFDGFLFFLVTLPLIPSALRLKFSAVYILCIAPWHIFSWIHLGSFFPDTLLIKLAQRYPYGFINGARIYFNAYPLETILSLLLLPLVLLVFIKEVRTSPFVRFLLITSLAHFTGYALLQVPPYHWYYTPEITAIVLIGSFGLGVLSTNRNSKIVQRVKPQNIAAAFLVLQALGMFYILARDGFALKEMPIHSNWATHEQYKQIGEWLNKHNNNSVIMVYGGEKGTEVGTIGYYCDCSLLSFFSDRMWLQQYVNDQRNGTGIRAWLHRANFLFLDAATEFPPPAYLLLETPNGQSDQKTSIMEWKVSTKWVPHSLIQLNAY